MVRFHFENRKKELKNAVNDLTLQLQNFIQPQ